MREETRAAEPFQDVQDVFATSITAKVGGAPNTSPPGVPDWRDPQNLRQDRPQAYAGYQW